MYKQISDAVSVVDMSKLSLACLLCFVIISLGGNTKLLKYYSDIKKLCQMQRRKTVM